ncbi:hypothetical protein IW140_002428 [Coemansia sp. RSA 1813]|nr:hypothetical protein EV178_000929 [Coemansia sp. RSA 1646]KAJ1773032.1 hypothetical protein LPJ74_000983 [Coemansia sp. RSA 1843]KAJ2092192.1 hypothetical protein IW138_001259 [Coemansia sp. RSA 986]KAJ2215328.1 hypothetical protein EV179_002276 [Coemansia sp. RSA 487]KAJ2570335.1 hypothetical protein IW140_002428 [Coemansia sp. RSA 1813]
MHTEIENAAGFWVKHIPDASLAAERKEALRLALIDVLCEKYKGHWNPEQTAAGSGYRSLCNWRSLDGSLVEAAMRANVSIALLERLMPRDIVVWCDPHNVTYRVGDHGTVYTIYEDKRGLLECMKKNMAEKVSKSNGDFVISAYTTPVVIRSADGVEIARRGGASAPTIGNNGSPVQPHVLQGSPTKGASDLRRNAMSPLRHVTTYRANDSPFVPSSLANNSAAAAPPPRWSPPSAPAS